MKHLYAILLFLAVLASCKKERHPSDLSPGFEDTTDLKNYNKDILIVNWNIEWFGSREFNNDLNVQETNAGEILKYLAADLYGICEVVDTARFGRMVRQSLGDEFRYAISPYPTIDQKLAVVYNRNIFRQVKTRPLMGLSSTAFVSFSSGRFPFLFEADLVVNGLRNRVHFIILHAKANADLASYTKRQSGALELKDSLDTYFKDQNCLILGDYNDNFNGSIVSGKPSPYENFLSDATVYNAITLPLNAAGYQSTITYENSVIDQQIISGGLKKWYVTSSAKIRTDVTSVVPDYLSRNTSDHYPVSSMYKIAQ